MYQQQHDIVSPVFLVCGWLPLRVWKPWIRRAHYTAIRSLPSLLDMEVEKQVGFPSKTFLTDF